MEEFVIPIEKSRALSGRRTGLPLNPCCGQVGAALFCYALLSGGFFAFFFISLYRKPTLGNVAIFIYFLPRPKQFRRAGRLTSFLKRSIGHVISLFFSILKRALSTDCTRLNSSANSHIRFWGSFLGGCFHPFPNVIWAKILHLRKTGSGFLLQPSPAPLKTPPIKYHLWCTFSIPVGRKSSYSRCILNIE